MSEPAEGRIERLLRRGAKEVRPYITGRLASEVEEEYGLTDVVKLASNENPLGPSPKAMRAARKAVGAVERYPDGSARALKKELARMLSLKEEELVIGNGGDDVLSILGRTLINEGDECIIPTPSFAPYETVTRVMGGIPVFSPLKDFAIDLEDIRGKIGSRTKLVYLCNPNNPTGTIIREPEFGDFLKDLPRDVIAVADEAYSDFVEDARYPDSLSLRASGLKNLFIVRTFSKIYGLAGFRVGYGIGPQELISYMHRVKEPFNVSLVAQAAALAALSDGKHVADSRQLVLDEKQFLYSEFERLGLSFVPTEANFIFLKTGIDSRELHPELMKRGVIIRPGHLFGYPEYVRLTIGTREENERFLEALRDLLKEKEASTS